MVAVVTGGSGSLGQTMVRRLLESGLTTVVLDMRAPEPQFLEDIGTSAKRLKFVSTNLFDEDSVRDAIGQAATFGPLEALINLAGGFRFGPGVEQMELADWESMITLNATSAFLSIKHSLPLMKRQNYGRIITVAARVALKGEPMVAHYAASKAAVLALTQSVAEEVRDLNITANSVLPSIIDTPMNRKNMPSADFTRWVDPADLADTIMYLLSPGARAVNGVALPVYFRS